MGHMLLLDTLVVPRNFIRSSLKDRHSHIEVVSVMHKPKLVSICHPLCKSRFTFMFHLSKRLDYVKPLLSSFALDSDH
jgi:uncharacterized Zn-finger protein